MLKQPLPFSLPEQGKARKLRAKLCFFFTKQQTVQMQGKLLLTILIQPKQTNFVQSEKIL